MAILQLITINDLENRGVDIIDLSEDFINTMIDDISAYVISQCIQHGVDFFKKFEEDEIFKQNVKSVCCDLARSYLSSLKSEYNSNIKEMTEKAGNLDLSFTMFRQTTGIMLTEPMVAKLWARKKVNYLETI